MMDARQLAQVVDAYAPALMLFARQWCNAPEDAVQSAFVKLVSLTTSPTDVVAWLYRTVRNAAIDASRADQRRQRRETYAARPESWFEEPALDRAEAEMAVAALAQLPVDQREVIVARLWGGMTFEQIADAFGISASSAFRRFEAGIAALGEKLGASR